MLVPQRMRQGGESTSTSSEMLLVSVPSQPANDNSDSAAAVRVVAAALSTLTCRRSPHFVSVDWWSSFVCGTSLSKRGCNPAAAAHRHSGVATAGAGTAKGPMVALQCWSWSWCCQNGGLHTGAGSGTANDDVAATASLLTTGLPPRS
ncbi:hypothetical protein GALMADRAFT_139791 [Galerina marginata CBS 339.88]|uniref:Uncharacterized protein n=1 Tax=Galerina marginata (strain CBS 339.88) TaxID=685588 RepID=A0A067T158_GALM3|nr:hypothetical protein GALMADRAFT_139791 [Galerina marginata CBS 339.88]